MHYHIFMVYVSWILLEHLWSFWLGFCNSPWRVEQHKVVSDKYCYSLIFLLIAFPLLPTTSHPPISLLIPKDYLLWIPQTSLIQGETIFNNMLIKFTHSWVMFIKIINKIDHICWICREWRPVLALCNYEMCGLMETLFSCTWARAELQVSDLIVDKTFKSVVSG